MTNLTAHRLTVNYAEHAPTPADAIAQLRSENHTAWGVIDEYGRRGQCMEWVNCESDLREHSARYPHLTFQMDCAGEDNEHWRIYAHNGKTERVEPELVYPDFDYSDLT